MFRIVKHTAGRLAAGSVIVVVLALALAACGGSSSTGDAPTAVPTLTAKDGATIYTIDSSSSKATFTIDEILFGQQNTVVGTTTGVSGQISVNKTDPSQSEAGEIQIDLSQLSTDSDQRNGQIHDRILETGDAANKYATFVPKSYSGLPSSVTAGQAFTFKITGDLTIHQVTKSETFDVTATLASDDTLTGTATTTVQYKDFNISVPQVPSVTGLGNDVKLELDFTAKPQA